MIRDAIALYNDLLDDHSALEAQASLNSKLQKRRLFFGARPICTVLRPVFYYPDQWAYLKHETEVLLGAFGRAHQACMADAALRAELDLEPYEEELFRLEIGYEAPWTTSRLDSFYDPDAKRLRFVEYNAETPAGMGYCDELSDAFLELEVFRRFGLTYTIRSFTAVRSLIATLLDSWRQYGGIGQPQVGIIDWSDVPTLNEHEIIRDAFAERGIKAQLADPRNLEYRQGALWIGDFRIDLIYKRVLCSELIHRMGMENPIVHALRDKAVMMTNAFSAKLMAKKASFAILSDERHAHLFTEAQQAAIEAHIPWTRRVTDRKTVYQGKSVDLLTFAAENRDRFVLKPNDEYGGKGVIIGWENSAEDWAAALNDALLSPHVVQEKVDAAYEDFPTVVDGKLNIAPRLVDADPYIYQGRTVSGCLTRLSSVTLLNVTAGGGSLAPTFVIERR
ncbi:MAG TPA: hypothetical protein PLD47_05155 [Aggregatilineales bacterium]|nr:hypothetical protein [Anaerolineales bacterium]HRE47093.1 hypothetical protein [Aggregatilineales bacterium]